MNTPPKNCPHCGRSLTKPNAVICEHCGTPLKAPQTVHGGILAKIVVHLPGDQTREEFLVKPTITLGRHPSNMIQVHSPIVSAYHAKLELTPRGHTISDLDSTNGTFVNGRQLRAKRPYLLSSNDVIRFSDSMGNSAKLTYIAPSIFGRVDEVDLTRDFQLTEQLSYIGRNPAAAIYLNHPAISWNHATVTRHNEDEFVIQDLSSNNGTFVNGRQLRQPRHLNRGDAIQIGPFNLVYQNEGRFVTFSAERNFRLEGVDLRKTFSRKNFLGLPDKARTRTVLRNLDLVINPREFVAVVGGSGTGKSTLMKMLGGILPPTEGRVLVNGDNLYDNFNLYRTMMGYVPQDDIIHQLLPVRRALSYAARLRLADATIEEMDKRIDEVLEKVGLTAEAQTIVQNLSGGQHKRVSIAVELLAEPWIFFLDEPTSGLDPGLEKLMMDTLRQLADEGRTIVLVTHATSHILDNCDHIAFLAPGGELAYFGPPEQAMEFFEVNNFADIYTRLAHTFHPQDKPFVPPKIRADYMEYTQKEPQTTTVLAGPLWAERYRRSLIAETYITNRQTGEVARQIVPSTAPFIGSQLKQLQQFSVLSRRYFDLIRHDAVSLTVLLAVMPLIGLFLLLISNGAALVGNTPPEILTTLKNQMAYGIVNQTQTLLFMMALSATMLGVFAAAFEIVKEEVIYQRERIVNLRILPYFASKFVVLSGFTLVQCFLLLLVLGLKVSYPAQGALLWAPVEYYITLVLTAIASVTLGLFISALATSRNTVIYLLLLALFSQIVFSGAIFELSLLTEPLSYLTIARWSLEGLGASTDMNMLNSLGQVRIEREVDFGRGVQRVVEDVQTNVEFFINYSYGVGHLLLRWIGLLGHTSLWSLLTLWLLRRRDQH